MKKLYLFIIALAVTFTVKAQWTNNAATNTFIANTSADAGEIYLSTDPVTGDTYMQWSQFASNGWVPKVQRLNSAGVPQWDASGLQPAAQHTLASWSQGFAMAATTDNAVVSCFSTEAENSVAVKINADGTFAWGEAGITLFNGAGGSRTELLAGDDGGVWALATNLNNTYLCYIEADGTTNPTITISDSNGAMCTFGLMLPAPDGNVWVVYEKEQWAYTYFYEKDVRVVGYSKDGTQISDDIQLMAPVTIPGSYIHYVVPDGLGGGYVYIWHSAGMGGTFNTYVFHFNQNGASTIMEPTGIPVHSLDSYNFYLSAHATVDPISHDLIIAYEQTDADTQSESRIYMNRISSTGDRIWKEGVLAADNTGVTYSEVLVNTFEYGEGFVLIYNEGDGYNSIVKAVGMDELGAPIWNTTMSSTSYPRAMCDNSTGFREGQDIITWVNSSSGGMYGQNIGWDGNMGEITPPTPPAPCFAPTNFQGEYVFSNVMYGAIVSWDAPETTPHHYNLYCENTKQVIEIEAEYTSYFQEMEAGDYIFKLTAVYEDCESDYALTPNGDNYLLIEVTSVPENEYEDIVDVIAIYNINGQTLNTKNINELNHGIYVVKGISQSGKTIVQKIFR